MHVTLSAHDRVGIAVVCSGYDARVADTGGARSVYYVAEGRLWGFGLLPAHANPCR